MQSIPNTIAIRDHVNPATWMLEVIGAGTSSTVCMLLLLLVGLLLLLPAAAAGAWLFCHALSKTLQPLSAGTRRKKELLAASSTVRTGTLSLMRQSLCRMSCMGLVSVKTLAIFPLSIHVVSALYFKSYAVCCRHER